MKITALTAKGVHGYLPINITFFSDLTFLTGLNGTGKTSALRLLMALLTPRLDELGAIVFEEAEARGMEVGGEFFVRALKTPNALTLRVSGVDQPLHMSSSELEVYMDVRRRDDASSPVINQYEEHPVIARLTEIATPMFLGLDRRFTAPVVGREIVEDTHRRNYATRRLWAEDPSLRGSPAAALHEVNFLVIKKMQEIRAKQEELDETLRNEFFTKAFVYNPSNIFGINDKMPSRSEVKGYREQLSRIADAAEEVRIPVPQIQSALTEFFGRMTEVVDSLERNVSAPEAKRPVKKKKGPMPSKAHIEWIINKPQADRILEHLKLLHEYIESRKALREPVDRFIKLINGFLIQTRKVVSVSSAGELTVAVLETLPSRSIGALSSGERQLVVMLGHLSLNPLLAGSGVFIVDEPELSLHIDWQEKFVDAVQRANPNVQYILATHSPAIILERVEATCDLSGA
jgi:predicted ATPase